MRRFTWMALIGVLGTGSLIVPAAVSAQKGTKLTATELRTVFRDGTDDTIRSDGRYYQTDAVEKTSNTLTATGAANYMLETFTATKGTPVRCVSLTPTVVAQKPGTPLPTFGCVDVSVTSHSYFFDSTDSLKDMDPVVNNRVVKRLRFMWVEGGFEYYLRFNSQPIDIDGTGPHQTANIGFTCTASTSGGCTNWIAEPIRCEVQATGGAYSSLSNCNPDDGQSNSLAVLERQSTRPNSTAESIAVLDIPFVAFVERRN